MNKKLNNKYLPAMQDEVYNDDVEVAHSHADDILCNLLLDLGYTELVEAYNKVDKWYA